MTNEEKMEAANREFREERRRCLKAQYVAEHAHELLPLVAAPSNAQAYVKEAVQLAGLLYEAIVREHPEHER